MSKNIKKVPMATDDYIQEQKRLHAEMNYGTASRGLAHEISRLITLLKPRTLSDYGAGKMALKKELDKICVDEFIYQPYDIAFPEYGLAEPAELVVCIDVLEHIEPQFLEEVIDELILLTQGYLYITVHCGPAKKILSDGRNAHLTQEPSSWWLPKFLKDGLELMSFQKTKEGFIALLYIEKT